MTWDESCSRNIDTDLMQKLGPALSHRASLSCCQAEVCLEKAMSHTAKYGKLIIVGLLVFFLCVCVEVLSLVKGKNKFKAGLIMSHSFGVANTLFIEPDVSLPLSTKFSCWESYCIICHSNQKTSAEKSQDEKLCLQSLFKRTVVQNGADFRGEKLSLL